METEKWITVEAYDKDHDFTQPTNPIIQRALEARYSTVAAARRAAVRVINAGASFVDLVRAPEMRCAAGALIERVG